MIKSFICHLLLVAIEVGVVIVTAATALKSEAVVAVIV